MLHVSHDYLLTVPVSSNLEVLEVIALLSSPSIGQSRHSGINKEDVKTFCLIVCGAETEEIRKLQWWADDIKFI